MNTEKRIEQCLEKAPKPSAPDALLNKLQSDVTLGQAGARRTALRRWLAPSGGRVSLWRTAAAAVIAMAVLLPLSYGAARSGYKLITVMVHGEGVGPEGEPVSYVIKGLAEIPEIQEGVTLDSITITADMAGEGQSPFNLIASKQVVICEIDPNEPQPDEESQ